MTTDSLYTGERSGLMARARDILIRPVSEWRRIAGEEPLPLIGSYVLPLAVIGAIFTLKLAGATINLYSQIGMILLVGLVTKNSILLVDYANQLRAKGMDVVEAMLEAGRIRLRPILMTSVATIMGAIPIALGSGAGATARRPLGYAIVGGIAFSTVLTLFVVPVVWMLAERMLAHRRGRVAQAADPQPAEAA